MEKLASGYGLIEGPVWDPKRGLIFSDVSNGGVYIVTGSEGGGGDNAGSIFRIAVWVAGLPVPPARVRVS